MEAKPGPLPDPGLAAEAERGRSARATEIVAGLLSVVWVVAVLAYILTSPPGNDVQTLGLVMTLLIVFLPLALIWVAVVTLRSVHDLRAEAQRLQAAVDAMRASYVQSAQQVQAAAIKPSVERKLDEIAAVTKQAESVLATFSSRRDTALTMVAKSGDHAGHAWFGGSESSNCTTSLRTRTTLRTLRWTAGSMRDWAPMSTV